MTTPDPQLDPDEVRRRVTTMYVPAISDVLDNLGYRHQVAAPGLIPLLPDEGFAGPALTIKSGPPRQADDPRRPGMDAIEAFTPGSVACYDSSGNTTVAAWGEFWTTSAQVRGCVGAVIDGGIRDASRMRDLGFPAHYRFRSPVDARGRLKVAAYNVPVTIAGVQVQPGDYVVADFDGVVFIPPEALPAVLDAAERYVDDESKMRVRLAEGERPRALLDEFGHF